MKKLVLSLLLCTVGVAPLTAQTIQSTEIKLSYSKEAGKAKKKGLLSNAGFVWNKDKTKLYKISRFQDKKTKEEFIEIQTFSQDGSFEKVEVLPKTDQELKKYDIVSFEAAIESPREELKGFEAVFIDNPTLAGTPDLVYGSFQEKFGDLGVFQRFKFQKSEKRSLEEKFWAQVFFPYGSNPIDRNNYLIQPPAQKKLSRAIFSSRNSYMPVSSKAYIGGLMATSDAKTFLSGVMDLSNSKWLHKQEITLPNKIYPGALNFAKHKNNSTSILIPSKDTFTLLLVDAQGKELYQNVLGIQKTGGQHGVQPSTALLTEANSTLVFASSSNGMSGGSVGLSIAKIVEGKEVWSHNFSNEDLENTTILPLKEKLKVKKFKMPSIQDVVAVEGGYILMMELSKNTSNGVDKVFMIIQLSDKGDLLASYPLPAVKAPKDRKLLASLPLSLVPQGDGFYVIARTAVEGYEKGQYTDVSSFEAGGFKTTTTSSYRIDETITAGYVAKINFKTKVSSNVIQIEDFIVGEFPGTLSKDGHLFLQSTERIISVQ